MGGELVAIRDRGKIKWKSAFFMPEHVAMLREIRKDDEREDKPILDEYQVEELEQKMLAAMEYTYPVKLKVWDCGFYKNYEGLLHRLDGVNKLIYLETKDRDMIRINFYDLVGVELDGE